MRWRDAGRGSTRRSRTFKLKEDAKSSRSRSRGGARPASSPTSRPGARRSSTSRVEWWGTSTRSRTSPTTRSPTTRRCSTATSCPVGGLRLREVTPVVLARFRADLRGRGVGRHAVRVSLVVVQMGHSPQMTLSTYTQVMRELKGQPALSAEAQVHAARTRGPQVALSRKTNSSRRPTSAPEALQTTTLAQWRGPESNRGHHDFQSCALPTELPRPRAASYRRARG